MIVSREQMTREQSPSVNTSRERLIGCLSALIAAVLIGALLFSAPVVASGEPQTATPVVSVSVSLTAPTDAPRQLELPARPQIEYRPASVSITAVGTASNATDRERPTTGASITPSNMTVVRGQTNLQPGDNAVVVELRTDDFEPVATNVTDQWGTDGAWSTTLNTTDLDPGTYVLEVTATDSSDRVVVTVQPPRSVGPNMSDSRTNDTDVSVSNGSTSNESTSNASTEPPTPTTASDRNDDSTDKPTENTSSNESVPGFGGLLTLGALFVFAARVVTNRP